MWWPDVRAAFPDRWLIIEALEAHTEGRRRLLDRIAVIDTCTDGGAAFRRYRELHKQHPHREFYPLHTTLEMLDIEEQPAIFIRRELEAALP